MTTIPAPVPCLPSSHSEKHERLLTEFRQLLAEYHSMEVAQVTAVLNGADFPFEEWISNAAERVKQARMAIITHRLGHGC